MIDFDPEIPYEMRPMIEAKIDAIESRTRKIGLYLTRTLISPLPDSDDDGDTPGIICTFDVGEVAFVQRVQNPEQAAFDQQFEALTTDLTSSEFDTVREELRRNLQNGNNPLGETT